ncbi:hypothetical protein PIB30_059317 [Stylosanthes scabra]|uniref:Uncharacterized protein n=1 Tax=Stylosanthes scabra TaxID=79078 RepID=A0ABU6ZIZ5_9FABA|nr:hypothetical protein [Stylosanthes scabra]
MGLLIRVWFEEAFSRVANARRNSITHIALSWCWVRVKKLRFGQRKKTSPSPLLHRCAHNQEVRVQPQGSCICVECMKTLTPNASPRFSHPLPPPSVAEVARRGTVDLHCTKVGFKMFLGVIVSMSNWDAKGTCCNIILEENSFVDFVELPDTCQGLYYCNILSDVIRGALEMNNNNSQFKGIGTPQQNHLRCQIESQSRKHG